MNRDDYNRFVKAMGTMAELYEKEMSPILQAVYFKALEQHPIEAVENCFTTAMVSLKFWPKPVELIEIITGGGTQNIEDQAHVVWGRPIYL